MSQKLSTQPYKGARDFYPEEMRVRNYIFDTWRKVCKRFGYEEYDGPFLESFDIYAAKTGEEIVNEQLYSFTDRGDRKVAIRPEMTPTLARMVSARLGELQRPIRWFSMPNLWRYEKPQRGRLREHFQLNVDNFGIEGITADYELITLAGEIMSEFGATKNMFELRVGNRRLIEDFYTSQKISKEQGIRVSKAIDKKKKVSADAFLKLLKEDAKLTDPQIMGVLKFLTDPLPVVESLKATSRGASEVFDLLKLLELNGTDVSVKYDPTIMRGFDYYTGNVFEQFDLNPENNRSMYGGGRYDDLVEIFTGQKLTGIGFGMGDVTLQLFLEGWNLLPTLTNPTEYFITLWQDDPDSKMLKKSLEVAKTLRDAGKSTSSWLEPNTKLDKQLKYADKKGYKYAVIIGETELADKTVTIKDLSTGGQTTVPENELLKTS